MHYYQFHIGDYKSHTSHLTVIEDCAYRRLLDFYYLNEKPINQRDVARQINMREYEQDVLTVLNEFFISTPDGFVHPRADNEINKYKEFINAGKRGAAKRWASIPYSPPNGEGNSPPNATPIATNNHKPITTNHINTPDGVEELVWQDWVAFRKKRRAPVTDRVVEGLQAEAQKANMTLNDVLRECVVNGWQSFKADWIKSRQIALPNKYDIARVTAPPPPNQDYALKQIEEDSKKAVPIPDNIREKMADILKGKR